jgi:trigger factor
VAEGDYVTIDLTGSQDGEVVDGLSADDYLYLVGSGMIASELDEHLVGAAVGAELSFDADHPDPEQGTVQFRVVVKGVKERVLPDLDDDWVAEATEFDTVEELRADTRSRLAEQREQQTRLAVRNNLGAELAKLVDDDVPEALVASEVQMRLQNMAYQLQGRGIGLDDYLRITGRDPEGFTAELKEAAEEAVRVDLALRAVAELEGIVATDDEVAHEVSHLIAGSDMTVEEAIEELRAGGQLSAVRSDIVKRNALEWLVERSEVVDPDGTPVPAELLALPDHDHDHADGDEHGEAPTDPGEDDDA